MRVEIVAAVLVILVLAALGAGYFIDNSNRLATTITSTSIETTSFTLIEPSTVTSLQIVPVTTTATTAETFTMTHTLTLGIPMPLASVETANIPVGGSPDTIAVNPNSGRIYVSGESNILTVVNATSYNIVANITLPAGADGAIAIDNTTDTIYVLLQNGVAEINGTTNQVIRDLPLNFAYASMA
jgi:DNA-binding beta-propeller fold protein YncE